MKTQLSKAIRSEPPYSGVYQQQGRMLTDADWNELTEIVKTRLDSALRDVIGSGTPDRAGAVRASAPDTLVWGSLYVNGIPARLRPRDGDAGAAFDYAEQRDYPSPSPLPLPPYALYVDVWERAVNALEDSSLRDVALHGADTTTRTETMAQVKWAPVGFDAEDATVNPTRGSALLTLQLRAGIAERDPCDPCADEIALSDAVGNYLFRVEVHDVDYAADGLPTRVVLKWSRENGGEIAYVGAEPPGFIADRWAYEFHHGAEDGATTEKHLGYLPPATLAGFSPARGELTLGYPPSPPTGFSLVRRWDGFCALVKVGGNWTLELLGSEANGADRGQRFSTGSATDAHGHIDEGPTVRLALDATELELELADHALLAGDFWSAAVREEAHVPGDVLIDTALPDGLVHHYMNLGVVDAAGALALAPDVDCKRFRFPRLTDLRAEDVCFDALSCEMPGVANVQQAIDRLCQERDLRWHNRHLHGWGIVCGLIVECGADTAPTDASLEPQRRRVIVTPGYALASDGSDIVLDSTLEQDMLDLIATHDATASTPIMVNGAGSACLILDRDASGAPTLRVERHVPSASPFADALRGTLLHDFYKDCIEHLIEALRDDLSFLDPSEIGSGEQATDISSNRRKLLAVANLVVQLVDSTNGSFVFLSRNEHATLAELYLTLRNLLQSRTFCGMFEGEEFPTYPFPDTGMDTIVGKGTHIRSVLHPNGEVLYTFGGPGRAIHAYQARDRKLIAVIDVPAAQGAEVTALAFTRDGRTMYIAAQIRGKDSLYGRCRVAADSASHVFERMTVLCDVLVTELAVDPRDDDQVFAIGQGRGLFRLLATVLEDSETESTVDPLHAFLASGGARFDFEARRAYATVRGSASSAIDSYSRIAVLDLRASGTNLPPSRLFDLGQAAPVAGMDDFDVRPAQDNAPPRLYIVAGGTSKSLRTYDIEETQLRPVATTAIPSTQIRVRWHPRRNAVLLAIEDEHRLAMLDADGARFVAARIPVQVFPQAITIDNDGDVQVLNLIFGLANTISIIPNAELATTPQFLDALAAYRTAMLTAFYRMFGHVLQYLKDCFCHHLLVKCPQPGANDTIYLACVDVRESQVFNVCNFSKRKYVKSFPTVDYWMSLVPVLPLLREAVGQFCCAVLPSIFARFQPAIVRTPPSAAAVAPITNASGNTGVARFFKGAQVRTATQTFQRTDVKATVRKESKGLGLLGMLAGDGLLARTASEARGSGVSKQALIGTDVEAASAQMQSAGVEVTEVRRYAAEDAGKYLQDYTSTPARVPQGSKVTLYERDGKVAFYAIEPSTEFRLDAGIGEELTRLEARKSELGNLASTAQNLEALRLQKDAAQAEVQALQRQVESLRELRTAEEARFAALGAQRETLASGMSQLGDSLRLLSEQHQQLRINLARDRSVIDVPGVSTAVDAALREAGIRTVGELADADPARLRAIERLQPGLSRTIIDAARGRITR